MRSQGRSPVGSRRRRARIFSYRRRIVLPILILIGAQVFLPPPPRASGSKRAKESSAGSAAASLEEGPGFEVRQVEIRTAAATLTLRNGVIYPAPSAAGVSPEMVFVGQGHIHIDPPDAIEAGQLRLFTHTDLLDRSFHEAVLVVTDEAARNSLLAKRMGGEWNAARRGRAERLWDLWRRGGERRALGIEAALFRANLGEAGRPPFLAAHLVSQDLGSFFLLEDPEEDEQIKVGRFFPITLNDDSRKKAQRELEHIQRKGFLGAFQLEDLGSVDTWMSFPLQDASGRPVHGRAGFKPLRYQMDIRIDKKDQHLSGKVEIDLAAREAGRRTALLTLDPDYTVQRITCGDSGSLTFRQDHELIMVVLPRALKKREKIALRVEYQGRSLVRRKKGAFVLLDTAAWYPRAGQVDRALYDVTFHWPWWLQLVASGRRVDGGREKGGMGWRRYRLDFPAVDFGFGLGKYEFSSAQAGHVKVRFAYDKGGQKLPAEDRRTIEKTVVEALGFYEETFGPYPLNDLQVVTWAHNFSQGFLGYVSLSNSMMDDRNRLAKLLRLPDRRSIIAHELAHQWWGHLVGWRRYRDQWLSESMAEYSSDLYSRRKLETSHRFTAGVFARWRDDLFATKSGRTLESMGPLVMGHRLDSSKSRDAFNIIIYTKGGLVLEMLSRRFKNPAAFPGMLRQIVKAAANRPISTEEFVAAIEKMSSIDLSSFAQQYIYGTGIPTLFYDYSFKKTAQGKWRVEGTIQQFPALRNEIRVERSEKGDLDVRRVEVPMGGTDGLGLVVPFQIQLKGKKAGVVNGRIGLRAGRTPFGLEIDQEPSRFRLDPAGEVLAVSLSQVDRPKAALLHLGLAQRRLGRKDEAEERLKEALAENDLGDERLAVNDFTIVMGALLGSSSRRRPDQDLIKPGRLLNEEEKERRRADLDRMARLELARLYLDQDRLSEARGMLEQTAEETGSEPGGKKKRKAVGWAGQDPGLVLLEARLALREQDYDGVLEKLQAAAEQLAVLKKSLEANTLLAAAAQGAGEDDAREKYSALARAAGADLTVLDE